MASALLLGVARLEVLVVLALHLEDDSKHQQGWLEDFLRPVDDEVRHFDDEVVVPLVGQVELEMLVRKDIDHVLAERLRPAQLEREVQEVGLGAFVEVVRELRHEPLLDLSPSAAREIVQVQVDPRVVAQGEGLQAIGDINEVVAGRLIRLNHKNP